MILKVVEKLHRIDARDMTFVKGKDLSHVCRAWNLDMVMSLLSF